VKDASTDLDVVAGWWKAEPANIGLVCGLAFDVLDVDKADGWQSLARLVDANGCLPSGPVSMTPGDGAHYFFTPTGIGNRASFMPHLDWRGVGGYVIAPPSVHPNGGVYEWAVSPDEVSLEPAPAWLLAILRKPATFALPGALRPRPDEGSYGRAALAQEVGRVAIAPVGERNHTLNRAAFSIGQLIAGRAISDATGAVQALLNIGRTVGLGDGEVYATVKSGIEAGSRQPRHAPRSLAS
jgi:hypothetical protein